MPVQITEKGTLLGSTETPRILVSAGSHELELTNTALEYRVTRTVQVVAGQTASITLKRDAFESWRTGYSSAFAIILFVAVFGLANIYVKALNRVKQR